MTQASNGDAMSLAFKFSHHKKRESITIEESLGDLDHPQVETTTVLSEFDLSSDKTLSQLSLALSQGEHQMYDGETDSNDSSAISVNAEIADNTMDKAENTGSQTPESMQEEKDASIGVVIIN